MSEESHVKAVKEFERSCQLAREMGLKLVKQIDNIDSPNEQELKIFGCAVSEMIDCAGVLVNAELPAETIREFYRRILDFEDTVLYLDRDWHDEFEGDGRLAKMRQYIQAYETEFSDNEMKFPGLVFKV